MTFTNAESFIDRILGGTVAKRDPGGGVPQTKGRRCDVGMLFSMNILSNPELRLRIFFIRVFFP